MILTPGELQFDRHELRWCLGVVARVYLVFISSGRLSIFGRQGSSKCNFERLASKDWRKQSHLFPNPRSHLDVIVYYESEAIGDVRFHAVDMPEPGEEGYQSSL